MVDVEDEEDERTQENLLRLAFVHGILYWSITKDIKVLPKYLCIAVCTNLYRLFKYMEIRKFVKF